jgi:excisionase family DNA binding protein
MWLTISEIAEYLRVSKETIYKLAQQSKIPASKLGNQWRFRRDLVDEWLRTQTSNMGNCTEDNKSEVRRG